MEVIRIRDLHEIPEADLKNPLKIPGRIQTGIFEYQAANLPDRGVSRELESDPVKIGVVFLKIFRALCVFLGREPIHRLFPFPLPILRRMQGGDGQEWKKTD